MNSNRPMVASVHGMVAAAHPLAAQAGARLLRAGGNAFDAAVATVTALNVVEPFMSGLAGIGAASCYIAAERQIRTLDFVGRVPGQFSSQRHADRTGVDRGAHTATTPGNLAGWCELLRAYGSLPLHAVFAPAIELGYDGFPLSQFGVDRFTSAVEVFKALPFFEEWNRVYTNGRGGVALHQVVRQPDLARTLEALATDGPALLFGGRLGEAVVKHVKALGGHLTLADLSEVAPVWDEPMTADYRGLQVHTLRPPSEAFQYLLTLRILDGFHIAALERDGAEHLDLVWRSIRLAAGERIAHNKPDPETLSRLFSSEHVDRLRTRVADGTPIQGPTEQWLPSAPDERREHTTSMSAADRWGNVVCLTQSLGLLFGCGVVVPGTGICLNNGLQWGDLDGRSRNALVPGTALAFPAAPSIATRDGRPVLALGTPGSYGIPQTQAQAMVQHVDFRLPIQDAIEAPRARLFDGRVVHAEARIAASTFEDLKSRGHDVQPATPWTLMTGGMQAIAIEPGSGVLIGAGDPRREGYAATP